MGGCVNAVFDTIALAKNCEETTVNETRSRSSQVLLPADLVTVNKFIFTIDFNPVRFSENIHERPLCKAEAN